MQADEFVLYAYASVMLPILAGYTLHQLSLLLENRSDAGV